MKANPTTIKEFLEQNETFSFFEFHYFVRSTYQSSDTFPVITEHDIPEISFAIRTRFKNKLEDLSIEKHVKRTARNRLKLEHSRIKNICENIEQFLVFIPEAYNYIFHMLIHDVSEQLAALLNEFDDEYIESTTPPTKAKNLSLNETAVLMQMFDANGFTRNGLQKSEIAFAFHRLTGYSLDSLRNLTSEKFLEQKGFTTAYESIRAKLKAIVTN